MDDPVSILHQGRLRSTLRTDWPDPGSWETGKPGQMLNGHTITSPAWQTGLPFLSCTALPPGPSSIN